MCWVRVSCVDTYMDTCVGYQQCVHVCVYTCIHTVQPSYIHVHLYQTYMYICTRCSYPPHMYKHAHSTLHVQSTGSRRGRKTHQTTATMQKHTHMMKRTPLRTGDGGFFSPHPHTTASHLRLLYRTAHHTCTYTDLVLL